MAKTIKAHTAVIPPKIMRTSKGLRDALFDELDSLREGRTNPQRSNSMAKLAGQIINSVKAEIEHQKHLFELATKSHEVITAPPVLSLGTIPEEGCQN